MAREREGTAMARETTHEEAGHVFPIIVWLAERSADAKAEAWVGRCDTPVRQPMRTVEGVEEPDPAFTKRAQVLALTGDEWTRFRADYVQTGLCQAYRDRESAALAHPEIDWTSVGVIYGIPV